MIRSKAITLAMVLLALLTCISLAACSKAPPATPPATATSPGKPETPAKPASPGQAEASARTGPPGSTLPKPAAPSQQTPIIPTSQANIVKGSGSISVAIDANLSFDTGGKIGMLYVKRGDRVTKGKLLASLDTTSLELALAQARVNLDQATLSQTSAELALETAKFNLDKTQAVSQIKDVITNIQWKIKIAQMNAEAAATSSGDYSMTYWAQIVAEYQKDLAAETKVLSDMLSQAVYTGTVTYDITGQKYDRLTQEDVRMKQLQVEAARQTMDKAQDVIDQAQKNLALAQKQLDNAVIIAPFDGMVATLNVKEGDIVAAPSPTQKPVIYLIEPTSMQIIVAINELDIPQVKIGQKAIVKINAFPNTKLDGKVTDISALPDLQGGVVNYGVTVSFSVPPGMDIRAGMNATAEITAS